jgi:hypothetical protein
MVGSALHVLVEGLLLVLAFRLLLLAEVEPHGAGEDMPIICSASVA